MLALTITAPGRTELREIPSPDLRDGEVLVRVRYVGFCGSDLSTFRGQNPLVSYPRIPGHEIAGTLVAVGGAVPATIREGDNVTVSPYTSCGACPACRRGRENACQHNETLGVQRDGAMTALIAVPWQRVLCSATVPLLDLALVEPLTVGFHAAERGRVTATDTVLVLGCGAIGLGVIAGCSARGARVVAVDVDDDKLAIAARFGAQDVVNTATRDLAAETARLAPGGPDVVVEAIGDAETFRRAVDLVAFTGRVVYVGYAKAPVTYATKLFVQKELDLVGSRNATMADFRAVLSRLDDRSIEPRLLVSRAIPLASAGAALAAWSAAPAQIHRIVVDLADA